MRTRNPNPDRPVSRTLGHVATRRTGTPGIVMVNSGGDKVTANHWQLVGLTAIDTDEDTAILTTGGPGGGTGGTVPGRDWHNPEDHGGTGDGSASDTAAVQSSVDDAAAAGGGTIYLPPGVWVIDGALQDTGAFNGQILLPNVSHSDPQMTLVFKGALRPPFHPVYGLDTADFVGGPYSVLKSTLTGATGSASCFSAGNDTTPSYLGGGNNLNVVLDDLICWSPENPTFTFWNLQATNGSAVPSLQISTTGAFAGTPTTPTNTNNYGIKLPAAYFSNGTPIGTLSVGGQYSQVLCGELSDFDNLILGPGINGLVVPDMLYPATVRRMTSTAVARVIVATGSDPRRLDVLSYVRESQTTGVPFETEADLDDATDLIEGYIRWHCTETGGTDHAFIKNGGANVGAEEMFGGWGSAAGRWELAVIPGSPPDSLYADGDWLYIFVP